MTIHSTAVKHMWFIVILNFVKNISKCSLNILESHRTKFEFK